MPTQFEFVLILLGFPLLASRAFYYSIPTLSRWYSTSNLVVAVPCAVAGVSFTSLSTLKWGWPGVISILLTTVLVTIQCRKGKREMNAGRPIPVAYLFSSPPTYGKNILEL